MKAKFYQTPGVKMITLYCSSVQITTQNPRIVIMAEENTGNTASSLLPSPVNLPSLSEAKTTRRPMATNTSASPRLKDTMSHRPYCRRPNRMASNKTISADGQGTIPPETPSQKKVLIDGIIAEGVRRGPGQKDPKAQDTDYPYGQTR